MKSSRPTTAVANASGDNSAGARKAGRFTTLALVASALILGVASLVHGNIPASDLAPGIGKRLIARVNADLARLDERWLHNRAVSKTR
jgi:hypothetical protein